MDELDEIVSDSIKLTGIDDIRWIVKNHQYRSFYWDDGKSILVDVTTANMIITVYDVLNEKNKAKFHKRMLVSSDSFVKQVNMCWKLVK